MVIEKKIWPEFFEKDKERKFDIRLADFDLKSGDVIKFKEWNPKTKQFTGREFKKNVKAVEKFSSPTKFWTENDLKKYGIWLIEFGEI